MGEKIAQFLKKIEQDHTERFSKFREDLYMSDSRNIIIICDCDGTLIKGNMQDELLRENGMDPYTTLWPETAVENKEAREKGKLIDPEITYLRKMQEYALNGRIKDYSLAALKRAGSKAEYHPGVLDFFNLNRSIIENNPKYLKHGIKIRYRIISNGIAECIRGMKFYSDIRAPDEQNIEIIAANEFDEIGRNILLPRFGMFAPKKNQYFFKFMKGEFNENDKLPPEMKMALPWQTICLIDGMSDTALGVESREQFGHSVLVYEKDKDLEKRQKRMDMAHKLKARGAGEMVFSADYRVDSDLFDYILYLEKSIADVICERTEEKKVPLHKGVGY